MGHRAVTPCGSAADAIVVGAGIVGAACARELASRGLSVLVIDNGSTAATAAGMGHLVAMDDSEAELALCLESLKLWAQMRLRMPSQCAYRNCGTYWVARNDDEMDVAQGRCATLTAHGVDCDLVGAKKLHTAEPLLGSSVIGALSVPGDGVVYAPAAARWMLEESGEITRLQGTVSAVRPMEVELSDGTRLMSKRIVIANGLGAMKLFPELRLRSKKGHLLITDRYLGLSGHQLVELGYASSAHASDGTSVAFNVQPRPTGQLLIGSSRQFDTVDPAVEPEVLATMLRRAVEYMPQLRDLNAIRAWTGFRVAISDGLPMLGEHPDQAGIWFAVGHEGLGVTTAPASASLLAALILDEPPPIDPAPYLAGRFVGKREFMTELQ